MLKYDISDVANATLPVPAGRSIPDTCLNVISGKIKEDIVSKAFMIKLTLIELTLLDCLPDMFSSSFPGYLTGRRVLL
jgi:hypothetical protein